MDVIRITQTDDRYTVREALRRATDERVLLVLPWDITTGWTQPLDFLVLRREVERRGLEAAWVIEDPMLRPPAREVGFKVFPSEEAVQAYLEQHGAFPPLRPEPTPPPPRRPWWAEDPQRPRFERKFHRPLWLWGIEGAVLLAVLTIVTGVAAMVLPSATVTLIPKSLTYSLIVPISVDPQADGVDLQRGVIPSTRIGDEFEAYAETGTTGRGYSVSGRAHGTVLLTNLLGQDYQVPAGTVVRTSAGSYPVRFVTTRDVTIPAFGQAPVPVEAMEEGSQGNVGAYQVNLVEGVAGFAVRVTNPDPISGAENQAVAVVSQADRDRVWKLAAAQVMAKAYNALQSDAYLEPGEFLPRQTMAVQAVPKQAYTNLVGEQSDTLGLSLRLLVTAQKVKVADVQAVAYHKLAEELPPGYELTDASFEYGESAEEDVGPGAFTFYVKAYGYATAKLNAGEVAQSISGKSRQEAVHLLEKTYLLAQPPQIELSPSWFPRLPFSEVRIRVRCLRFPQQK